MRFRTLFFLLLLAFICLTLVQGSYEDCCLKYVKDFKKNTKKLVTMYRKQVTDGGCNLPAIVFSLKSGRQMCADPRQLWVKNLMKILDKRQNNMKKQQNPHKNSN